MRSGNENETGQYGCDWKMAGSKKDKFRVKNVQTYVK